MYLHADHFMRQRISVQAQPVYQFIAYRLQHFPYYLVKTVYSAPRYVRKLCPVPKPTYQKHDYLVQVLAGFSLAAATHRDIQVILEPRCQRYMPPAPKLCHRSSQVRGIKIFHKLNAKNFSRAHCDGGISGKIAVNLYSKKSCCND